MPDAAPAPVPVRVALPGGRGYAVCVDGLAALAARLAGVGLRPGPCFVVTDAHVGPLYLGGVRASLEGAGWAVHALTLPAGEETKSAARLAEVYEWALASGIERGDPVLAFGGGVVGDLAGFCAATLLRGVPLVHLPTSLVAQVDSAVGGKTGINHAAGKNLIGAFWQPCLVLADVSTLATLPPREFDSGLAEVVKAALIADAAFFEWLEANWSAILGREAVGPMVRQAVALKAEIVVGDEREAHRRALLNFGHTFGHAIERAAGYGRLLHGEAVALGMRAALHLSASLAAGRPLPPDAALPEPFGRADRLVAKIPVPPDVLAALSDEALGEAMRADKKRADGRLRFVVLDRIGAARVATDVPTEMVAAAWAYARRAGRGVSRAGG